ncbi:hypothetical protein Patl1_22698 [Pistacia atlantica]|uniref:Uncharacterized protein n=1 Tax=Pistacia atlantica TaxID=434234 RepID=A0ACC1A1Q7_9ROSI|nr:hypothetical protein Patl1_22698 [Pistacia atlantica]
MKYLHQSLEELCPLRDLLIHYLIAICHLNMLLRLGSTGMIMGKPVMDPAMYAQQSHPYMAQQMWPQGPEQQQSPSDH